MQFSSLTLPLLLLLFPPARPGGTFSGGWGGRRRSRKASHDGGLDVHLKGARYFSMRELQLATDSFNNATCIGVGGYGRVYRGMLATGEAVAVKCAGEGSKQGTAEFRNEIELLSRVHHKNLVSLLGFSNDHGEQILVYPYMAGGNIRQHLTAAGGAAGSGGVVAPLSWRMRLEIAVGAARGLAYLHTFANPPIIHRDVKSSNILLDDKMVAKVADFGLSKLVPDNSVELTHLTTQVKGTLGYMDPEYYRSNQVTEKSDVYSFGIVLLELVTGMHPITDGRHIVSLVKERVAQDVDGHLVQVLDPHLGGDYGKLGATELLEIAFRCVSEHAADRPSMTDVEKYLELILGNDVLGFPATPEEQQRQQEALRQQGQGQGQAEQGPRGTPPPRLPVREGSAEYLNLSDFAYSGDFSHSGIEPK
eukprot:jgi/Mesen1/1479/ME000132S00424